MLSRTLALILTLAVGSVASAADWPQWLGPDRDGVSSESVAAWTDAPKVLWRANVGEGHSSPIVADGRVYLHTRVKDKDEESVEAFDAVNGESKWQKTYPRGSFSSVFGLGPRATPAYSDGKLVTLGVTGLASVWDAKSGEKVWQKDILKDFEASNLFFGVSASPLIDGERVVLMPGGKKATAVALKLADGGVKWEYAGNEPASYASPITLKVGEQRQAVFLTGSGLSAINAEDGKLSWKVPFKDGLNESSTTPIRAGGLLIASTITKGSIGLRLGKKDDKDTAEQVWAEPALTCYFSTPVPVGKKHLFMVTGKASLTSASSTLRCVDAENGKEIWKQDNVGRYHAALLRLADGKLLLHGDDGKLRLLAPNVEKYEELCVAKVCGRTWAHPALADGRLYIRDDKELICLEMKK